MSEEIQIIQNAELVHATEVHRRIITNATLAQQSIWEVGAGLKEMRDGKLYKQLGYDNFEQYCTNEIGLSRKQSYRYIGIIEKLGENVSPVTQNLGMTKLSLLADLSEDDREAVIQRTDIETISKRELESKIAQIKAEKEAAEKSAQELAEQAENAKQNNAKLESKLTELSEQLAEANAELAEAKDKPVEVAVDEETSKENEKLREQLAISEKTADDAKKKADKLFADVKAAKEAETQIKADHAAQIEEAERKYQEEIEKIKKDYEEQLAAAVKPEEVAVEVPDIKEMFKVHLRCVIDAAKNMMSFLAEHPDEACKEQAKKSLAAISEQM